MVVCVECGEIINRFNQTTQLYECGCGSFQAANARVYRCRECKYTYSGFQSCPYCGSTKIMKEARDL